MQFRVLTLFPEQIEQNMTCSISGRALERACFGLECVNIREFSKGPYHKVDDRVYGGGTGLLMQCEPVWQAYQVARATLPEGESVRTIYLSPKGKVLNQNLVNDLAKADNLILICGHYEGIDARVLEAMEVEEVSLGDFVLTGGELAACVLMDSVIRRLPGVLPDASAYEEESHYEAKLECRHYTMPKSWMGLEVPEVLISGHHAKIQEWRQLDSWAETYLKRPDLFDRLKLSLEDYEPLIEHLKGRGAINGNDQS